MVEGGKLHLDREEGVAGIEFHEQRWMNFRICRNEEELEGREKTWAATEGNSRLKCGVLHGRRGTEMRMPVEAKGSSHKIKTRREASGS